MPICLMVVTLGTSLTTFMYLMIELQERTVLSSYTTLRNIFFIFILTSFFKIRNVFIRLHYNNDIC